MSDDERLEYNEFDVREHDVREDDGSDEDIDETMSRGRRCERNCNEMRLSFSRTTTDLCKIIVNSTMYDIDQKLEVVSEKMDKILNMWLMSNPSQRDTLRVVMKKGLREIGLCMDGMIDRTHLIKRKDDFHVAYNYAINILDILQFYEQEMGINDEFLYVSHPISTDSGWESVIMESGDSLDPEHARVSVPFDETPFKDSDSDSESDSGVDC
jgi:hypothetical protein